MEYYFTCILFQYTTMTSLKQIASTLLQMYSTHNAGQIFKDHVRTLYLGLSKIVGLGVPKVDK